MACKRGAARAVASPRFCKTAGGVIVVVDVEPGIVVVKVDVKVTAGVAKVVVNRVFAAPVVL